MAASSVEQRRQAAIVKQLNRLVVYSLRHGPSSVALDTDSNVTEAVSWARNYLDEAASESLDDSKAVATRHREEFVRKLRLHAQDAKAAMFDASWRDYTRFLAEEDEAAWRAANAMINAQQLHTTKTSEDHGNNKRLGVGAAEEGERYGILELLFALAHEPLTVPVAMVGALRKLREKKAQQRTRDLQDLNPFASAAAHQHQVELDEAYGEWREDVSTASTEVEEGWGRHRRRSVELPSPATSSSSSQSSSPPLGSRGAKKIPPPSDGENTQEVEPIRNYAAAAREILSETFFPCKTDREKWTLAASNVDPSRSASAATRSTERKRTEARTRQRNRPRISELCDLVEMLKHPLSTPEGLLQSYDGQLARPSTDSEPEPDRPRYRPTADNVGTPARNFVDTVRNWALCIHEVREFANCLLSGDRHMETLWDSEQLSLANIAFLMSNEGVSNPRVDPRTGATRLSGADEAPVTAAPAAGTGDAGSFSAARYFVLRRGEPSPSSSSPSSRATPPRRGSWRTLGQVLLALLRDYVDDFLDAVPAPPRRRSPRAIRFVAALRRRIRPFLQYHAVLDRILFDVTHSCGCVYGEQSELLLLQQLEALASVDEIFLPLWRGLVGHAESDLAKWNKYGAADACMKAPSAGTNCSDRRGWKAGKVCVLPAQIFGRDAQTAGDIVKLRLQLDPACEKTPFAVLMDPSDHAANPDPVLAPHEKVETDSARVEPPQINEHSPLQMPLLRIQAERHRVLSAARYLALQQSRRLLGALMHETRGPLRILLRALQLVALHQSVEVSDRLMFQEHHLSASSTPAEEAAELSTYQLQKALRSLLLEKPDIIGTAFESRSSEGGGVSAVEAAVELDRHALEECVDSLLVVDRRRSCSSSPSGARTNHEPTPELAELPVFRWRHQHHSQTAIPGFFAPIQMLTYSRCFHFLREVKSARRNLLRMSTTFFSHVRATVMDEQLLLHDAQLLRGEMLHFVDGLEASLCMRVAESIADFEEAVAAEVGGGLARCGEGLGEEQHGAPKLNGSVRRRSSRRRSESRGRREKIKEAGGRRSRSDRYAGRSPSPRTAVARSAQSNRYERRYGLVVPTADNDTSRAASAISARPGGQVLHPSTRKSRQQKTFAPHRESTRLSSTKTSVPTAAPTTHLHGLRALEQLHSDFLENLANKMLLKDGSLLTDLRSLLRLATAFTKSFANCCPDEHPAWWVGQQIKLSEYRKDFRATLMFVLKLLKFSVSRMSRDTEIIHLFHRLNGNGFYV